MFPGDIPRRARLHLIDELSKTARTLSNAGLRLEFPEPIPAGNYRNQSMNRSARGPVAVRKSGRQRQIGGGFCVL